MTIAPLGIACHAGHCYGPQVLQLGRTVDWSPVLVACISPSGPMRAFLRKKMFWSNSGSPMYKEHGVFSKRPTFNY